MSEKQSKWKQFGQILRELEFITALFSWLFNLLSRVAEPLMTLAVIYTIIVAGIPHAYQPAIYNTAIAAMISAPEIILPGAFIQAGQEHKAGNPRAWLLFTVCSLFVVLTTLTLADLFIFHFDEQGISILMCARCVTGVSYSIVVRVVNHREGSFERSLLRPGQPQPFDAEEFMNQVLARVEQMNHQLAQTLNGSQAESLNQLSQSNRQQMSEAVSQIEQAGAHLLEQLASSIEEVKSKTPEKQVHVLASRKSRSVHRGLQAFSSQMVPEHSDIQPHEQKEVHLVHESLELQKSERVSREQVCAFILDYWCEHHQKPTIKFIRARTGCSQGLASTCCNLLAQEMSA